ncbi:MAG TPA: glycosyltransferase family 4 protein [Sulfuricaulis sp.]|nr:glycosyltransferase family 4 protein [Sulfuricaulis sp.]
MGINILHTEWSKGWGGQEIRVVAESVAFRGRGYQVTIACQPDSLILPRAQEAGIPVIPLVQKKGLRPAGVLKAMRIIRAHRFDLVHTHSSVDAWNFGLAARFLGVPVVRSRHLSTRISRGPLSYLLYMKLADRVITSGQAIKDVMVERNRMRPERIVSIPAGIDESRFLPSVDASGVRAEFGLRDGDFVVGIVAVLRSWKGHQYLIEAAAQLRDQGVPVKLLIVGAGPQEGNLRRMIHEKDLDGVAIMTGYRQDVPALMKAMQCLALPSTDNEATSQVLPQAMAMKVAVIATDVGGLAEVVINHDTGLLVPTRDTNALTAAIRWIYEHPQEARQMAERGYDHALANFTFDRMIERTEQVYLDVLKSKQRSPR